ncbi:hypothetical protein M406DRAFT_355466 [Cryphonectria parasitica EP155]|uniref:Uncharacterized protein n=1 Tax=Cryphonectria parasitica (strain ATCC 38755 / EP155) TaxID=660469 RepID=A0A9P4Y520_CRYP1|nr:uncharacterized protein M406DRAFT_355466 [Cryphonectria parasitica EP155]KAF3767094.1 hypothetical protein M406DRAFT_355466 [Cryphonectria parasitica EP155]
MALLHSRNAYYVCNEVSALCPVSATTLGYYPNKPLNIFVAVAFGLAAVITLGFGIWKRTWAYMSFIAAGCVLELAGYVGRVLLNANPWNQQAFELQICAIILAPTLICISIYLTLKHLCLALNPTISRVPPRLFPYLFVPADVSCLLIQAIGGSLATQGDKNLPLLRAGDRTIIAGIALQVVVLLAFGLLSADYWLRARRWVRSAEATEEAKALWGDRRVRMFVGAMMGAYLCVQVRCIYRVAEMAGGWGNPIMQDQPSFTVLDSFMMLITAWLLACFPPGIFFPNMTKASKATTLSKREELSTPTKTEDAEKGVSKGEGAEAKEPSSETAP